jgi:hypothetical protein
MHIVMKTQVVRIPPHVTRGYAPPGAVAKAHVIQLDVKQEAKGFVRRALSAALGREGEEPAVGALFDIDLLIEHIGMGLSKWVLKNKTCSLNHSLERLASTLSGFLQMAEGIELRNRLWGNEESATRDRFASQRFTLQTSANAVLDLIKFGGLESVNEVRFWKDVREQLTPAIRKMFDREFETFSGIQWSANPDPTVLASTLMVKRVFSQIEHKSRVPWDLVAELCNTGLAGFVERLIGENDRVALEALHALVFSKHDPCRLDQQRLLSKFFEDTGEPRLAIEVLNRDDRVLPLYQRLKGKHVSPASIVAFFDTVSEAPDESAQQLIERYVLEDVKNEKTLTLAARFVSNARELSRRFSALEISKIRDFLGRNPACGELLSDCGAHPKGEKFGWIGGFLRFIHASGDVSGLMPADVRKACSDQAEVPPSIAYEVAPTASEAPRPMEDLFQRIVDTKLNGDDCGGAFRQSPWREALLRTDRSTPELLEVVARLFRQYHLAGFLGEIASQPGYFRLLIGCLEHGAEAESVVSGAFVQWQENPPHNLFKALSDIHSKLTDRSDEYAASGATEDGGYALRFSAGQIPVQIARVFLAGGLISTPRKEQLLPVAAQLGLRLEFPTIAHGSDWLSRLEPGDVVIVKTRAFGHTMFYALRDLCVRKGIPVVYLNTTGFSSTVQCLEAIVAASRSIDSAE